VIIKIHKHGKGSQSGAQGGINYLLDDHDHTDTVRSVDPLIERGDVQSVRDAIASIGERFNNKYTSGVLSFEESNLSAQQAQIEMESFEQAMFPGMRPNQYAMAWVRHEDKGRTELNFIVANVELQSGKRLQPYYDHADRPRLDAWKNWRNAEMDYADPNDPARARTLSPGNLPKARHEIINKITDHLEDLIEAGAVSDRAEVLQALKSIGLEVTRDNQKSISIKPPGEKNPIRLKGSIYERSFSADRQSAAAYKQRVSEYREARPERASAAFREYRNRYKKRLFENQKRHPKRPESPGQASDVVSRVLPDYSHSVDFQPRSGRGSDQLSNADNPSDDYERGVYAEPAAHGPAEFRRFLYVPEPSEKDGKQPSHLLPRSGEINYAEFDSGTVGRNTKAHRSGAFRARTIIGRASEYLGAVVDRFKHEKQRIGESLRECLDSLRHTDRALHDGLPAHAAFDRAIEQLEQRLERQQRFGGENPSPGPR
jgi:hypothetical protein